jgi:CelD/BcsL family acetyltransferase involved in cellulose biosynthesis
MPSLNTTFFVPAAPVVVDSPAPAIPALFAGIVRDRSALAAIGPAWEDLFERAGGAHQVFQTHGFVSSWAETFIEPDAHAGSKASCVCELTIVTLHRNGRLVLVWPLVLQRRFGLKIVSWLGEPFAQYADMIVDPHESALPLMRAAWRHVQECLAPDIMRLRRVRRDATLQPLLDEIGAASSNPQEAPFVALGAAAGNGGFEARQSGKARKNRRRLLRRLEECGKVEMKRLAGSGEAQCLAREALASKREWAERRGLLAPAIADPRFAELMWAVAGPAAAATGCALFALMLDGRMAAVAVGFRCKDRLMLHLIAHAEEVEKFGVGVLNLEHIMRAAESEGVAMVDMLPPTADYKMQWADGVMPVADYNLALTATGRVYRTMVDGLAKPLVRHAFDAMPLGLRQRLARRQFHHA